MPGGDRTGPAGMGPMTGRGAGNCAGYPMPGYANPVSGGGFGYGRGYGFGRGFGRGRGMGFRGGRGWGAPNYGNPAQYAPAYAPPYVAAPAPEQELDALQGQAQYLTNALEEIRQRIAELEAKQSE
ncbi:MAG: DUF5320 domain-containing protein [Candidatus Lernaella stagnicola]|nr:DUF5320 domain-containing protein [Candidatus Lernaella stagnicola]